MAQRDPSDNDEKKRRYKASCKKRNASRVYIGNNIDRWNALKVKLSGTDAQVVWHLLKVHKEHCKLVNCCKPLDALTTTGSGTRNGTSNSIPGSNSDAKAKRSEPTASQWKQTDNRAISGYIPPGDCTVPLKRHLVNDFY